jgi:hypothetical protein
MCAFHVLFEASAKSSRLVTLSPPKRGEGMTRDMEKLILSNREIL